MSVLRNRSLLLVSFGHFATDLFASLLPMAWPLISGPMGLTYGMVGTASTIYTVGSSLTQPIFGYLGDRFSSRLWAALGLSVTAIFMGLIGFVDNYLVLIVVMTIMGLGVAAYHPQGAMNASLASGNRKATGMSVFSIGGTAAYAIGPLLGGFLFTTALGLKSTALLAVGGVLTAAWLYRVLLATERHKEATAGARAGATQTRVQVVALAALIVVVGLRAWAYAAANTYLPLLYQLQDLPLSFSGQVLFLMQAGGVAGLLMGGMLADRLGRRRVVAISLALLAPAAYLLFNVPAAFAPLAAMAFGFVGDVPNPITMVMGQELLPRNVGVASGLIFGLAFVTGGAGVAVTGFLADGLGLLEALSMLPVMPLLASGLCLMLPASTGVAANPAEADPVGGAGNAV